MEAVRNIDVRLSMHLAALELLVIELAREVQERKPQFATNLQHPSNLEALAKQSIPGHPEISDMLTAELQEAWSRLIQRIVQG